MLYKAKSEYEHSIMAWWALHFQKNETAKTTPIASAFKNCRKFFPTCRGKIGF
jgi:hypothetical protein